MNAEDFPEFQQRLDAFSTGQQEVLGRIGAGAPLPELLERIVRLVEQQTAGMPCSILLLDAEKRCLRHGAAPSLPAAYSSLVDGLEIGPEAGCCGAAACRGERIIVADIAAHPNWAAYKDLALPHGLRACWSSPIFSPTREVLGTFAMYYREPREPSPEEIGWVDAATHLAAIAIRHDTTQAALLRSEAEFRVIFENAAMGMTQVDATGRVLKCNPAMAELLGYSREEVQQMTIAQYTHPDDLDLRFFHELTAGTRDHYQYERRYLRKDGQIIWVRITSSCVREADGRFRFVVGMIDDVTQRHRAEEEHARLEAQLRQSQKMQSLGTLAGGIAHDFNNILTAICGNTQLALEDLLPAHPARVSVEEIESAAERAADLVRQILAFSRPQEPKRKVMNLQSVVGEALRLLRASLPATIAMRTEFDTATPDVAADASQIHQVIMNLGANAAHAIGDCGGSLEFRLASVAVDAALAATSTELRAGHYARLSVSDDGCGMTPDIVERIFDPFFTTKKTGQGTGLGLSVVHGIIKGHSGAITVDSQPGCGTAFHLYFPAADGAASTAAPEPIEALRGRGQRLLYVDDEEHLVFLAQRSLSRLGYEVTAFHDARQALAAFRAQPAGFDLLITDLAMPGLSGLDFTAAIRTLRGDLPVILTSGYLRPQDAAAARRLGIRELLPKPAPLDQLARAIQRALQSR